MERFSENGDAVEMSAVVSLAAAAAIGLGRLVLVIHPPDKAMPYNSTSLVGERELRRPGRHVSG